MDGQDRREERTVIRLCGVQGCCPTVEIGPDGAAVIRDDGGSQVTLTRDQQNENVEVIRQRRSQ